VLGGEATPAERALAALAERALQALLGGSAPPLYTLVAFTQERLRDVVRFHRWWRGTVRDTVLVAGPSPTPEVVRAAAGRVLAAAGGPERVGGWLRREFPFWRPDGLPRGAGQPAAAARKDLTAST
jgi:hypothetical protein